MGCTPSQSTGIYTQNKVCQDRETCSTIVPSLRSSVSTPERSRVLMGTSSGKQTLLSGEAAPFQTISLCECVNVLSLFPVPCRDVPWRPGSQASPRGSWSSVSSAATAGMKPRSPTRDRDLHNEDQGND